MKKLNRKFTVAPMLDWTDRHCRFFHRLLTKEAILYTEMVTTGAILYGDPARQLRFNSQEHPVALQLGGSEPQELAQCARIAQDYGYDEINLNVGCPSERVQKGAFGACLMAEPQLIAECVSAMQAAVAIPITVKNRIGIDDQEDYADLHHFIDTVSQAGCQTFIIHARKAWLKGLSPKENRDIPPLRYDLVYQIKQAFPALEIIINGGITTLEQCQQHLQHVDGVMVGREAYHNPWLLAQVDPLLYGTPAPLESRQAALLAMLPYVQAQLDAGVPLGHISRHLLGLFQGMPGARAFRRLISENAHKPDAGVKLLRDALAKIT
ncbi:tRNA dihydrouridine(20/20a) synthase DusA [Candidatus Thiothrix anitrata]|uniref:tRNA-dihydrouridine(20/20a) synthase n=1 Tax=Candidatus Thiothrix anitrata TaxID=2823902 RepID=A0ABX7X622_9GAMM|nr:tRNA dihydrouridine(20/20a) synthase DusA [Candidatus Thiothrix anitrata]QTR51322.1 tRNA dihydrouridine(20/20a) synthase DusA [Candidatus Thiothrix anitrata]